MEHLLPKTGDDVLDVTLGLGGHAAAFLRLTAPDGHYTALDADRENMTIAQQRLAEFGDRITYHHVNFGRMGELDIPQQDIVFGDLGLSSPHLDDPARGFTFRADAPLDMRYDRTTGRTAADIIADSDVDDLNEMFRLYGELWNESGKLARLLAGKRLATTHQLKGLVEEWFSFRAKGILPQVFQALRIAVNDELKALGTFLSLGPGLLKPGGRMGVLSYHSLEDRMVKKLFRSLCEPVKDELTGKIVQEAPYEELFHKAIQAGDDEIARNPRARSVKFRAIRRRSV